MDDSKKPLLLLVDDSPSNLHVLSEALGTHYDIRIASNGSSALQFVHEQVKPDMILLDVMMPEMDGYEVTRRLKSSPYTNDIPIIFITAKNSTEDEEYGLSLGALDYISKPFDLVIVQARVRNLLQLKRQQDELVRQKKQLEKALREIKVLQGFLPICSHCKQIRDDQGYWNNLEAYISRHSEARFTHTLCPQCADKLYPELKKRKK
ncbi:response regulator [Desulfogranum japonicum]|uniref:response regulator n=1 Tax=Desulfogranum japonicum TaxID=231447 RepID=UPI0003F63083|nr:response regulator [Desulfogranum japonicum]